jgi:hypothetical protein
MSNSRSSSAELVSLDSTSPAFRSKCCCTEHADKKKSEKVPARRKRQSLKYRFIKLAPLARQVF